MTLREIVGSARRPLASSLRNRRRKIRQRQKKLTMETLEQRLTLSVSPIWVSNTDDSGIGSLRAAIEEANQTPGKDTINFRGNIGNTIALESQLYHPK